MAAMVSSVTACRPGSVSAPLAVLNTTWVDEPPWAGKLWSSRSIASWDSVSGSVNVLLVVPPATADATPAPMNATIHSTSTRRRRRTQKCPKRYNNAAMRRHLGLCGTGGPRAIVSGRTAM